MQIRATQRDPFPSQGLDNYFFTTPALRLRLDFVQQYIRHSETPVLILGESGAGKSTLLNQLVCRADHNWRVIKMPAVPSFSASDVVMYLNAELRLPTRVPAEEMLREFDGWLDRLAVRRQIAVVVVDNAHELCDESLTRLATLREEIKSRDLCVLMTGEPELRRRLSGLLGATRSRMPIHAINIPPLDRREVATYIDMRLYHAGLEGSSRFSRATIDDIARNSRGHPGRINAIAEDLLNGESKSARWRRTSQHIRRIMRHWSTLTGLTAAVAIGAIVGPESVRVAGEGHAAAHSPGLPVAGRNRRSENADAVRALVLFREILPRLWGNGR
jgi:type II secretory pathway predicted ATPase ExeA